jgi:hypothetical protein
MESPFCETFVDLDDGVGHGQVGTRSGRSSLSERTSSQASARNFILEQGEIDVSVYMDVFVRWSRQAVFALKTIVLRLAARDFLIELRVA